jgi:uncharacterized protein YndB with AHSA1/START domain
MRFTATATVSGSIERVFGYLDDPELIKKWASGLEAVVFEKPGVPRAVGTRFGFRVRRARGLEEYQGEVTAYRPPREIAARLVIPQVTVEVTCWLVADGQSTRVEQTVEWTPHTWPARLVAPLNLWLLRRQQVRVLRQMKEAVELAG